MLETNESENSLRSPLCTAARRGAGEGRFSPVGMAIEEARKMRKARACGIVAAVAVELVS